MLFSYYDSLRCFHTFLLVSGRYPLFHCRRFLRYGLGSTKVCWTKFYAIPLTVFSRSSFSGCYLMQYSVFSEVAYLSITSHVFDRFLSCWKNNICLPVDFLAMLVSLRLSK